MATTELLEHDLNWSSLYGNWTEDDEYDREAKPVVLPDSFNLPGEVR